MGFDFKAAMNTKISLYSSRDEYNSQNAIASMSNRGNIFGNIWDESEAIESKRNIIDTIRCLDDNEELSMKDLVLAKQNGITGVKKVGFDGNAGIATFELENGEILAIDFETESETNNSLYNLKKNIESGDAKLVKGLANMIQGGTKEGDIYLTVPKGTPLENIIDRYNLPDNALDNYKKVAHNDKETIAEQVWFSVSSFAEENGLSVDDVKAMFNK